MQADIADPAGLAPAIDAIPASRPLLAAVNCAGIGVGKPFLETDAALPRRIVEVNLVGAFEVGRLSALAMQRGGKAAPSSTSRPVRACARTRAAPPRVRPRPPSRC